MQFKASWILLGLVACLGIGATAIARQKAEPPPNKPTPPPVASKKPGNLSLDGMQYQAKTQMMTGRNLRYTMKETVLTGLFARYDSKNRRLWAEGNLTMDDPRYHITGEKAEVDDGPAQVTVITGNVVIVLKPKEEAKGAEPAPVTPPAGMPPPSAKANKEGFQEARKQGVTITCDRVEHYRKKRLTILRGNLVFKQRLKKEDGKEIERTLTASHAEYYRDSEQMTLFSPVEGKDSEGQEVHFQGNVVVGVKEGEETMETKERADIKVYVEEDEEEPSKKPSGGVRR